MWFIEGIRQSDSDTILKGADELVFVFGRFHQVSMCFVWVLIGVHCRIMAFDRNRTFLNMVLSLSIWL